jgi:lipopolysaccharide transport system permease protein
LADDIATVSHPNVERIAMAQTFLIRPAGQQSILDLRELWQYRHLLLIFVWRTLRVRYQQTIIGVAWAVLQPLLLCFVFTVIFGMLANVPTNGQPYPIFVLSGLLVWLFVAQGFTGATASVVGHQHLITKIYFPRVILLLAAIAAALVDFCCAFGLLVLMMIWYGIAPSMGALFFLPMLALAIVTVFGLSLWLSALYVPYRDVGHLLPFLVQLWMFLSPVIYPTTLLPPKYSFLYALNPLVVVIDTSRWAFAAGPPPAMWMVVVSSASALFFLISGMWFFRRQEPTFADVV